MGYTSRFLTLTKGTLIWVEFFILMGNCSRTWKEEEMVL